jgi:hypothetical protein
MIHEEILTGAYQACEVYILIVNFNVKPFVASFDASRSLQK